MRSPIHRWRVKYVSSSGEPFLLTMFLAAMLRRWRNRLCSEIQEQIKRCQVNGNQSRCTVPFKSCEDDDEKYSQGCIEDTEVRLGCRAECPKIVSGLLDRSSANQTVLPLEMWRHKTFIWKFIRTVILQRSLQIRRKIRRWCLLKNPVIGRKWKRAAQMLTFLLQAEMSQEHFLSWPAGPAFLLQLYQD